MATVEQFLALTAQQIGITESPRGSNCQKFSRELGRPCEKWCQDGLVWVADQVGLALPSRSASTSVQVQAWKRAGRWGREPRRGAWPYFDFPDKSTGVEHVGVCESWTANSITSIDFNTSVTGSQDNGGAVRRRTRSRSLVVGFGYPAYSDSPPPPPPKRTVTLHTLGGKPVSLHVIPIVVGAAGTGYWPNAGPDHQPEPTDIPYSKVLAVTANAPQWPPADNARTGPIPKIGLRISPTLAMVVEQAPPNATIFAHVLVAD